MSSGDQALAALAPPGIALADAAVAVPDHLVTRQRKVRTRNLPLSFRNARMMWPSS